MSLPEVVQPALPTIATGDPTRDDLLRTLTGALADLKQEAALRALRERDDPALAGILLGYLSDTILAVQPPRPAATWDELRKVPLAARQDRETRDHRDATAFSRVVQLIKWTMRALAACHDPRGDNRLLEIFATHPLAMLRIDAGDAIVRPGWADSLREYTQRPAMGSRRALEGVAALLDHPDDDTDARLLVLAAQAGFKLDAKSAFDRLAPHLLDGASRKKGNVADAIVSVARLADAARADPRWQALIHAAS